MPSDARHHHAPSCPLGSLAQPGFLRTFPAIYLFITSFKSYRLSISLSLSASFRLEACRPLTRVVQLLHSPALTRCPSPLDLCWEQMGLPKMQRTGKRNSQVVLSGSCLSQPSLAGAVLKLLRGPLSPSSFHSTLGWPI